MAKNPPPPAVMYTLITGRFVSHLIYVAAKLELADRLRHGPRAVEELATDAGVQASPLYRVLRALASVGVFAETKGKRFKLTPLAITLRKAVRSSMHAAALLWEEKCMEDACVYLLHGVKTGEIPFLKAHGVSLFEYFEKHPEVFKIFGEAMTSVSSTENPAIAAAYKLSGIRTLVDVGGGNGSLLATILKANPKLKGVLFDLPSVSTHAKQDRHVTATGIAERCTKILANCCAAMSEKGRVLVVESVIPPGNDPDLGKLRDIQMLLIGGRERTKREFAMLFREAGLKLTRVVPTKCPLSIVEGVRA